MPATHKPTVVVIGNGMVGARLCQLLSDGQTARRHRIVVFGEEPVPAYDRIRLSKLISAASVDDLTLLPMSWYEDHDIELHVGDPIVEIEPEAHTVRSAGGVEARYHSLVLATGSDAAVPPIAGAEHTLVLRSAADADELRNRLSGAERVAVVGGGLLGLEAATGIHSLGTEVCVIETARHLMPRQLDAEAAAVLARILEDRGLEIRVSHRLLGIAPAGGHHRLSFTANPSMTADAVVCAVGVRPRDQLAREAGLAIAEAVGGIIVGDDLSTSQPDIYAIGDCASHRGEVYGLVGPGYEMARVLAERMNGGDARFSGGDRSCRLMIGGTRVSAVGDLYRPAREIRWSREDRHRSLLLDGARVVGARAIGAWPAMADVERAIADGVSLDRRALRRFTRAGELSRAPAPAATSWPDDTTVCFCIGVTVGEINRAIREGARCPASVAERTRASTVCGSCEPQLLTLCTGEQAPVRRRRGLASLSYAALVACAAILILDPVPFADSVQAPNRWLSQLWRDSSSKQFTGFALLGTGLVALALSARKRLPWLRLGKITGFQVFHAGAGVLCAGLVVAHTGMHLGENLNLWLMTVFLATLATGGLLGLAVAVSGRVRAIRVVSTLRPALTWTHLVALWALAVLIGFHVFSVYYF